MIDTLLNLIFRCSHRRLSRPVTPSGVRGEIRQASYVVCLDCGKRFAYDTRQMLIGKPLGEPARRNRATLKVALWASLPLAMLLGSILKIRKPPEPRPPGSGAPR
jgi:hypothetical protein